MHRTPILLGWQGQFHVPGSTQNDRIHQDPPRIHLVDPEDPHAKRDRKLTGEDVKPMGLKRSWVACTENPTRDDAMPEIGVDASG